MSKRNKKEGSGIVYVLSNPAFKDDILKVGRTGRDVGVTLRAQQLRTTGVPMPFVVERQFVCSRMCAVERVAHDLLVAKRLSNEREFFKCSLKLVEARIKKARAWTSWSSLASKAYLECNKSNVKL